MTFAEILALLSAAAAFCAGGFAAGTAAAVFQALRGEEKKRPPAHAEKPNPAAERMARQFENIMNYDGTERGQRTLED